MVINKLIIINKGNLITFAKQQKTIVWNYNILKHLKNTA